MKDVCEGRKTKNEVVHESIQMYREVFGKANQEVNLLVEVVSLLSNTEQSRVKNTFKRIISTK